jgi:hypothetical protein
VDSRISFSAETDQGHDQFDGFITEPTPGEQVETAPPLENLESESVSELLPRAIALGLRWQNSKAEADVSAVVDLTRRGGIPSNALRAVGRASEVERIPIRLITDSSLSPDTVSELFDQVVLTPDEDFVIEALRIIDPLIERIATTGTDRGRLAYSRGIGYRGGLFVRCSGVTERIPVGSLGDGIWRLLGLALALVRTEGGILLVDEIDTGLHYGVMGDMWKLVNETSRKHDIQVFATTHSRDCYESLAAVCRDSTSDGSEITIQRVEQGKSRSIAYTEREIIAAAQRGMEVR